MTRAEPQVHAVARALAEARYVERDARAALACAAAIPWTPPARLAHYQLEAQAAARVAFTLDGAAPPAPAPAGWSAANEAHARRARQAQVQRWQSAVELATGWLDRDPRLRPVKPPGA